MARLLVIVTRIEIAIRRFRAYGIVNGSGLIVEVRGQNVLGCDRRLIIEH